VKMEAVCDEFLRKHYRTGTATETGRVTAKSA